MSTPRWDPLQVAEEDERRQLARQIAESMDTDQTQPVKGDPDCWVSCRDLRELEHAVVQGTKQFLAWASLAEQVMEQSSDPTVKARMQLERVNGLRRPQPEQGLDIALVDQLMVESESMILELPDSARRDRLEELLGYHRSIWARKLQNFAMSAGLHDKSADLAQASGNEAGVAISRFCASVARVNLAMVSEPDALDQRLAELRFKAEAMYTALAGRDDAMSRRWLGLNGPAHLITSHLWAGDRSYSGWDECRTKLRAFWKGDPEYAETNKPIRLVLDAVLHLQAGSYYDAAKRVEMVIDGDHSSLSPEYLATAHWVEAEIERQARTEQGVKRNLDALLAIDGQTQVSAAARRAFAVPDG